VIDSRHDRTRRVAQSSITAYPDEGVRDGAMKAGAIGFLAKPFAMLNLIACLDAALASQAGNVGA